MHSQSLILIVLFVSLLSAPSAKGVTIDTTSSELPLKELALRLHPENLFLGMASQHRLLDTESGKIVDREFGYVTPVNDCKQSYIHPEPDKWQWNRTDEYFRHASRMGQSVRVHGPIGPQCSSWARNDSRTAAELSDMLDEYMTALCFRISKESCVKWLDVVNETVCIRPVKAYGNNVYSPGDWFGPRPGDRQWENPWLALGFDTWQGDRYPVYIRRAFEISNKYCPGVKQIINQHSKLDSGFAEWERIKKLVGYLRSQGLRVDGIGWQAHIDTGIEKDPEKLAYLDSFISWCHENGLEFHITEMNVWINKDDTEDAQAATFRSVFDTVLPHVAHGVVGLCFWNVRDSDTDKPQLHGTLWRDNGSPRPAYFALRESLMGNAKK